MLVEVGELEAEEAEEAAELVNILFMSHAPKKLAVLVSGTGLLHERIKKVERSLYLQTIRAFMATA